VGRDPLARPPEQREHALGGAEVGQTEELIRGDETGQAERGRTKEPKRAARSDDDVGVERGLSLRLGRGATGGLGIASGDPRARQAPTHGMLDAFGAPAERRQSAAATGRTYIHQWPGRPAEPTRQRPSRRRVRERDRAAVAPEDRAALVAAEDRRQ